MAGQLGTALDAARAQLAGGGTDTALAGQLDAMAKALPQGSDAPAQKRLAALGDTLEGIAKRLRG